MIIVKKYIEIKLGIYNCVQFVILEKNYKGKMEEKKTQKAIERLLISSNRHWLTNNKNLITEYNPLSTVICHLRNLINKFELFFYINYF